MSNYKLIEQVNILLSGVYVVGAHLEGLCSGVELQNDDSCLQKLLLSVVTLVLI